MAKTRAKQKARKEIIEVVWSEHERWRVKFGRLVPPPGRPHKVEPLFTVVAEKLPFECIHEVCKHFVAKGIRIDGVYIAHDSMGCPRYVGRGDVFGELKARRALNPLELTYFSFYIVEDKNHEREIETLLIRAAGPLLHFNERKKRVDIEAGSVRDFEARTKFYERQRKRGPKPKRG